MKQASAFLFPEVDRDYPVLVRGEGNYVYDRAGKKYLDAVGGGVAVVNIGHGVPEVLDAIAEQARKLAYFSVVHFANEPQLELAEQLLAFAPPGMGAVYFLSSGSEAIEYCVKVARLFHLANGNVAKTKIISRWQGYHGSTLLGLSLSGRIPRRRTFSPMLMDCIHIEPSDAYRRRHNEAPEDYDVEDALALEKAIRRAGAENVAAFIAEPIVGATAGAVVPSSRYFQIIREICDRYDVLFIADEVMTGCGRTGRNFAIEHWGVTPDLIAVGKGISSGYAPLSACIMRAHIVDVLRTRHKAGLVGPTHGGNPVSCAAGIAVLAYLRKHQLVERCAKFGGLLLERLRELSRQTPWIGDVRGKALLVGIEFVSDRSSKKPFDPALRIASRIGTEALARGLSVYPGNGTADGISGDHILLAPPFTITEEEIEFIANVLGDSIAAVQAEISSAGPKPSKSRTQTAMPTRQCLSQSGDRDNVT
jgi:adenosylmethionine-8-amino-7-oxononanoate aminotransferase